MRRLLFAVLVAFAAAPVAAQVKDSLVPLLPLAPRGMDYVETTCTGGIDGRYEATRVLANGRVDKVTARDRDDLRARATRGEVATIWRQLDRAGFERRIVPPEKPYVMDGINCSLTRRLHGRVHTVSLMQQQRDKPQYRDLSRVVDDVNALGRRATPVRPG